MGHRDQRVAARRVNHRIGRVPHLCGRLAKGGFDALARLLVEDQPRRAAPRWS